MTAKSAAQVYEVIRFFSTALVGLIIDVSLASALIIYFAFADIPAAAIGLAAGMVFNYFVHATWTFQHNNRHRSWRQFFRYAIGVAVTMLIRAAVLQVISQQGWQDVLAPPIRLGIGAVVSFVFSYLIGRYLVFKASPGGAEPNP